jgi:hypothetical protein
MKVMANSIPKGGTHLLLRLFELLEFEPYRFWIGADLVRGRGEFIRKLWKGSYGSDVIRIGSEVPVNIGKNWLNNKLTHLPDNVVFGAHCQFTPELSDLLNSRSIATVCIVRDPRAIAVSHMDYIKRSPGHFFHRDYIALPDDDARLLMSIDGGKLGRYTLESLQVRYQQYIDWGKKGGAHIVRFEDLVGARGGGCDTLQIKAINSVVEFLSLGTDESRQSTIASQLFGDTNTFRKGQVDSWKNELRSHHKHALHDSVGDILIRLGYENNASWVDGQ